MAQLLKSQTERPFLMPSTAKNVLIVEDNPIARESLAAILEREGYEVAAFENGLQGVDYLATNPIPDVIVLDMLLPVLDGWQFLDRMSVMNLKPKPWIILTSGHPAIGRDWALAHGCNGFLRKPIAAGALFEEIGSAFRR
jgi:CheY-like chemotaxis protein